MVTYDRAWFADQGPGARQSAEIVVPHVLRALRPNSVLDVGCGAGHWAAAFTRNGVEDVIGIDGEYVDRADLVIAHDRFLARDLAQPLDLGRRFDLAVSLEVGEHLDARLAGQFVESLTGSSDLVLFSAAIPNQGGTDHRNEQWPSYWARLFLDHGYRPLDVLRPLLWADDRIDVCYRQNMLLFATDAAAEKVRLPVVDTALVDIVHPELLTYAVEYWRGRPLALREFPPALLRAVGLSLRRRIRSRSQR